MIEDYNQDWQTTMPDGLVVDNKDPEMLGRLKIRVAGIHDGVPDEHLPWAINGQASGRGPTATAAQVRIPMKGSRVKVNFHNDPSNPEYYGGVTTKQSIPEVFRTNYPNRNGELFPNGTHWYLDEKDNVFYFSHCGFTCKIDSSGNCEIVSGTLTYNSKEVNWKSGTFKLSAPTIINDSPTTNMTGTTNSTGLITGQGGLAVSGSGGGISGAQIRGNVQVIGGDVTADEWSLKRHTHDAPRGLTSPALPG